MAKIIYHGPNMHGVEVVGDHQDYWCPKGEESDDIPDDLAARLIAEQPRMFATPTPTKKAKSAKAQED